MKEVLRFVKLSANGYAPSKGSLEAAGYDKAKGKITALTDIQISVPAGCYGRVAPRSGLAHKNSIHVFGLRDYFAFKYL